MAKISFSEALIDAIKSKKSYVCIGLDPNFEGEKCIPKFILKEADGDHNKAIWTFNKHLIDATHKIAAVYKPQMAFYEKYDAHDALKKTIDYIHKKNGLVILDAKRNDIGNTSRAYVHSIFNNFKADATTVNGYLGSDCIYPFMEYHEKGIFVLVKTSNSSSVEFQDKYSLRGNFMNLLREFIEDDPDEITADSFIELFNSDNIKKKMRNEIFAHKNYLAMANLVEGWSNSTRPRSRTKYNYTNIGAVVGATFPRQLKLLRKKLPESIFLIPGFGAQGGTAKDVLHGFNDDNQGAIINSSRSINYAFVKEINGKTYKEEEYAEAAKAAAAKMQSSINKVIESR